ncbi:helix-turn-helix domain-containing protein [Spirosoma sp. HMF4905]|uniref:Helix-turn-helix domain-containing protein n=1 Tax=Spirosoma arboris TaxID=2682092 RepID=A0A7K1SRA3_9BACT|nr:helix-turn-helix domain-containing protein [Spirosoma arboris]
MKEARVRAGLTPKELRERLGVSVPAVNKLEKRNTPPSVTTLERVAQALGRKLVIEFD